MKKILLFFIKLYRTYLSPLKHTRCPYHPTCSAYGMEAIETYGAFKGSLLAGYRILRCNPFSHGGYDPVPETFQFTGARRYIKVGGLEFRRKM